jgi:hypothetical protein
MLEGFAKLSRLFLLHPRARAVEVWSQAAESGNQRSSAARTTAGVQQLRAGQATVAADTPARLVHEGGGIEEVFVCFHGA